MRELAQLKALAAKLRATGKVTLGSVRDPNTSLSVHRLVYLTDGDVPEYWPITGRANFAFEYDETTTTWNCTGNMFGIAPVSSDPKTFLSSVAQGATGREQTLRGFLQQTGQVAERYAGDLPNLCYKLGLDTVASGTMVQTEGLWTWTASGDPGIVVYFSADTEAPRVFELRKSFFGFSPDTRWHMWELSQANLMSVREQLKTYAEQAKSYTRDLSGCFS